jgi:hypothetical protein
MANSTDPSVWVNKVTAVTTNESGTECSTYKSCLQDLQAGQTIDYEGAGGAYDFNQYHNVFTGWDIVRFDSSGKLHTLYSVSASTIAGY